MRYTYFHSSENSVQRLILTQFGLCSASPIKTINISAKLNFLKSLRVVKCERVQLFYTDTLDGLGDLLHHKQTR